MTIALKHRLWLPALLLLSACSLHQAMDATPPELNLLPPAEGPTPVLLKLKVNLLAGQREQQFLAVARFDRQQLKLVLLLPNGQRLLTIAYDGENLTQQSHAAFELPGREILAIMQFSLWPEASLRAHYPGRDGWRVDIDAGERRLLTGSGSALTIAIRPGELHIDNHLKEYRVIVHTLEKTDL